MLNLFEKINEFFKDIMIDIIKDNLSAMLVDINDKVSTVAGEVGKTKSNINNIANTAIIITITYLFFICYTPYSCF